MTEQLRLDATVVDRFSKPLGEVEKYLEKKTRENFERFDPQFPEASSSAMKLASI
jgi:hypothetical protein